MSDQEINIAIAEACGWKDLENEDFSEYGVPCFMLMGSNNTGTRLAPPDYCNDLNAMHEAEKVFEEKGQRDYSFRLLLALVDGSVTHDLNDHFIYLTATARQRAEAFLRTLKKWEETK